MVRRDMESLMKRFWKCENTQITLQPINPESPREGGRVVARVMGLDVRTFMPYTKTYHGVYGEDFITFGEIQGAEHADEEDNLIALLDSNNENTIDKHTFKFENNKVHYSRVVNGEVLDDEVHHAIEETALDNHVDQTWTESMFYGIGNKNMWVRNTVLLAQLFN